MEWCSLRRVSLSVKAALCYGLMGILFFLNSDAAQAADLHQILRNVRGIIVPLTGMVLVISFVFGVFLIFRALGLMKKFGMMQSMHTQPGELSGPLTYLVVGSILIYLPTSTDYMMNSLFETTNSIFNIQGTVNYQALGQGASILGYSSGSSLDQYWLDLANTLILYIQFLGFLSFVKGWFILSKAGNPGGQPGHITKGITHVIGGIGLINIVGVVNILRNTVFGT